MYVFICIIPKAVGIVAALLSCCTELLTQIQISKTVVKFIHELVINRSDGLLKFDSYAGFKNPICNFHTSNQLKIDAPFLCD